MTIHKPHWFSKDRILGVDRSYMRANQGRATASAYRSAHRRACKGPRS